MATHRIPTKRELERLQRLYKTDEKIAERLGEVPSRLVAYWRRKKGVANYSAPKFSEKEVRDLWERFGEDYRCGAELGISKAAFYNWRRRYRIMEKPAFLKLEQMELFFPTKESSSRPLSDYGKRPAMHKALWLKAEQKSVRAGEKIVVAPDIVALDRHAGAIISAFKASGSENVFNSTKIALGSAFRALENTGADTEAMGTVERWARRQQVRYTSSLSDGTLWEFLERSGALAPGKVIVCEKGAERYAGAMGSAAIGLESADLATVLRTGKVTLSVPAVVKVTLTGRRMGPICATDILFGLCARIDGDNLSGKCLEFSGESISHFLLSDRQALCAAVDVVDLASAMVPADATIRRHISELGEWPYQIIAPDKDAEYDGLYQLNIEQLAPMVCLRQTQQRGKGGARETSSISYAPVEELSQTPAQVVFIGGSPGGHFSELARAAEILRGKKIARDVTLVISPLSRACYLMALKKGILRLLVDSGAVIAQPGIDSTALHLLGVDVSSRIFTTTVEPQSGKKSPHAGVFVISPATAAASALTGRLTDPRGY